MRKTDATLMLAAAIGTMLLSGCVPKSAPVSELPDGSYTGQSEPETDGSYGIVDFTISGGKVADVSFIIKDKDGTPHDENYGLGSDGTPADKTFYQRAQNAIEAEKSYMSQLKETNNQNEVESIAGASVSYRVFLGAIRDAVESANEAG